MKKTVFTICSITAVCCAIVFSCTKDDNSITHVTYVSQAGTGTNPDPNHTANSTSGATTSTTNTNTANTSGSLSINGSSKSTTDNTSVSGGNYVLKGVVSGVGTVKITFTGTVAPTSGSYNIVSSSPTATDCMFSYFDANLNSYPASSGTVTVTTGTPNVCTFSSINCASTYTLTGTLHY
jgi:hypothetical protein